MKHWTSAQLATLRRLREGFLSGSAGSGDYWRSAEDLTLYDATFGERIGWKWDAVLSELSLRGWRPKSRHLLDFGCGSGIAGRRVAAQWPSQFTTITLHDRSKAAMQYAQRRAREIPHLDARTVPEINAVPEDTLLVLSHVINELPATALDRLLALCAQAREILWVEAGTHADSRRLITAVREPLRASGNFAVIAPCTHQANCGMLTAKNSQHWCHSFAVPPSEVFQDARWAEFSRELGIDLRALPYSFLALARPGDYAPEPAGASRIIGTPREYKGFSKVLSCQAQGVAEFMLQKRDSSDLFREMRDTIGSLPCYRWELRDGRIVGGTRYSVDDSNREDG